MDPKFDTLAKEVNEELENNECKLETLDELLNADIPEEQWLIDRVLPSEGFTFIVGAEATGKSFYTLTIADAVTSGKNWLGKEEFAVKQKTKVLFMDKENTRRRIQGRTRGLGINENSKEIYRIHAPHTFSLLNDRKQLSPFAKSVSKQVVELGVGLIIVDSFADFMLGSENSAEDVQVFFNVMRQLFPTQAVLVLHHENKPMQGITRTSSQRVRGSTNITAQLVSGFRVFAIPKTQNEFVLEQFKAGDSEKLKPFKVELVVKPTLYDPTKTYVSEVKWNGEYYDEEGKAGLAEDAIMEYLEENPVAKRKELIEYCNDRGFGRRVFDKVISALLDGDQLEKIRDGMSINYIQKWMYKGGTFVHGFLTFVHGIEVCTKVCGICGSLWEM